MDPMEDLHYNPYFSGSWIAMAEALYNEIIEYEDGRRHLSADVVLTCVLMIKQNRGQLAL